MKESILRLFKAIQIDEYQSVHNTIEEIFEKGPSAALLKKTFMSGFIFAPEVIYNYTEKELFDLADFVISERGISPEELNATFHKSWSKIRDAGMAQLVLEQCVHYMTTYGFERFGIYDQDSVYIPMEKLDIPNTDLTELSITVIKGYTEEEIKEKTYVLLKAGIAFKKKTVDDVVTICKSWKSFELDADLIKNKEIKTALCDHLGIFPRDPIEFLRYLVYKATGNTLLIKDRATIEGIKASDNFGEIALIINNYVKLYGLKDLARVFYRFKPLFLSFRAVDELKPTINRMRKLAYKYHKPMKLDYLNEITAKIKRGDSIDEKFFAKKLEEANNFRKIRLAYALNYRTIVNDPDAILYRIRNGKGFAEEFSFHNKKYASVMLNVVMESIISTLKPKVMDKTIYIPSTINYALPATEKQFTGNIPSGSSVVIDGDVVFGVHWQNVKNSEKRSTHRIDLDLSAIECVKLGWDARYRSTERNIMFSGDLTDAPLPYGATEMFYVSRKKPCILAIMLNYYNAPNYYNALSRNPCKPIICQTVPFEIIIAKETPKHMDKNYIVNQNNVKTTVKSEISADKKQKTLGLVMADGQKSTFYFCESGLGNDITSSINKYTMQARKYFVNFFTNPISLNVVLERAGARIISDKEKEKEVKYDIDLSLENLEKDHLIKLLS